MIQDSLVKSPLKWAGGKSRIMDKLRPFLPLGERLVEPFAGSCTVMMNTNYPAYLVADINPDLIGMYQQIKSNVDDFLCAASRLFDGGNDSERYYRIRADFNDSTSPLTRGPLFLYLNRHGYNGLCRYNRGGKFNVPFGRYKKPYFPETEIRAFAEKAQRAVFICANYHETLTHVRQDDVVYCDPPYFAATNEFTAYHTSSFSREEHGQLAGALRELAVKGVKVVASNSDLDQVHELYSGFHCHKITAPRSIGSSAAKHSAHELIITSVCQGSTV